MSNEYTRDIKFSEPVSPSTYLSLRRLFTQSTGVEGNFTNLVISNPIVVPLRDDTPNSYFDALYFLSEHPHLRKMSLRIGFNSQGKSLKTEIVRGSFEQGGGLQDIAKFAPEQFKEIEPLLVAFDVGHRSQRVRQYLPAIFFSREDSVNGSSLVSTRIMCLPQEFDKLFQDPGFEIDSRNSVRAVYVPMQYRLKPS